MPNPKTTRSNRSSKSTAKPAAKPATVDDRELLTFPYPNSPAPFSFAGVGRHLGVTGENVSTVMIPRLQKIFAPFPHLRSQILDGRKVTEFGFQEIARLQHYTSKKIPQRQEGSKFPIQIEKAGHAGQPKTITVDNDQPMAMGDYVAWRQKQIALDYQDDLQQKQQEANQGKTNVVDATFVEDDDEEIGFTDIANESAIVPQRDRNRGKSEGLTSFSEVLDDRSALAAEGQEQWNQDLISSGLILGKRMGEMWGAAAGEQFVRGATSQLQKHQQRLIQSFTEGFSPPSDGSSDCNGGSGNDDDN